MGGGVGGIKEDLRETSEEKIVKHNGRKLLTARKPSDKTGLKKEG